MRERIMPPLEVAEKGHDSPTALTTMTTQYYDTL